MYLNCAPMHFPTKIELLINFFFSSLTHLKEREKQIEDLCWMKFCPKIPKADNQFWHCLFEIYSVINALFTNMDFTITFNGSQRSTENEHEKLGTPPNVLFFFPKHHPKCCFFFLIASETCSTLGFLQF